MAKDMLDTIKQAEDECTNRIKTAQQNAVSDIEAAHSEADKYIIQSKDAAKKLEKEAIAAARAKCTTITEKAQKQAKEECEALKALAQKNRQSTINKVIDSLK